MSPACACLPGTRCGLGLELSCAVPGGMSKCKKPVKWVLSPISSRIACLGRWCSKRWHSPVKMQPSNHALWSLLLLQFRLYKPCRCVLDGTGLKDQLLVLQDSTCCIGLQQPACLWSSIRHLAIDLFTARILSAHIFVHVSSHVRYTGFHERQQLVRGHSHCAEVVVVNFVFVSLA